MDQNFFNSTSSWLVNVLQVMKFVPYTLLLFQHERASARTFPTFWHIDAAAAAVNCSAALLVPCYNSRIVWCQSSYTCIATLMKCSNENGQNGSLMKIRWNGKTMRKKANQIFCSKWMERKNHSKSHKTNESRVGCVKPKSNSEKYEPFASNHIR